jgi:predicted deacylase
VKKSVLFLFAVNCLLLTTATMAGKTKYELVQSYIREIAANSQGNAQVFSLGLSDSGALIEGLQIGSGPVNNLVVAAHHGNEYGSTEVAKALAADLAKNPIYGQTVWIIPVLNVSGYNTNTRREKSHDPNRDYPNPCETEGPFLLKSTRALADFIQKKNIVVSATLHTYYPVVAYPWGFATEDLKTNYDDLFIQLSTDATMESGYQIGNSAEMIYPAVGTYEDYAFWKHGIWSLLFELGFSHSPSPTEVKRMIAVNVPGIRRFLTNAPTSRGEHHEFTGNCSYSLTSLDKHDE